MSAPPRAKRTYILSVRSLRGAERAEQFASIDDDAEYTAVLERALLFILQIVGEYENEQDVLKGWVKEHQMRRSPELTKEIGPMRIETEAGADDKKLVVLYLRESLADRDPERGIFELEDGTTMQVIKLTHPLQPAAAASKRKAATTEEDSPKKPKTEPAAAANDAYILENAISTLEAFPYGIKNVPRTREGMVVRLQAMEEALAPLRSIFLK